MGSVSVKVAEDEEQVQEFVKYLLKDMRALERMLEEGRFEIDKQRIGTEQELCLVDSYGKPAYIIDLHSFSAQGGMFAISSRHESHTKLLRQMDVPVVFGMENELGGTVLDYFRRRGHVALAFEGGQHGNDKTVTNKIALLYQLLEKTGNLCYPGDYGELQEHTTYLKKENRELPATTNLIYRYKFDKSDNFAMHPGYTNFSWIREGQHIADDRYGKIHASQEGYLLMPLYQEQGTDGFFLIRDY